MLPILAFPGCLFASFWVDLIISYHVGQTLRQSRLDALGLLLYKK